MQDFTITKFSWHARLDPDPAFQDQVRARFRAICNFLVENGLNSKPLNIESIQTGGDFELRSSDLTPLGLQLMKSGYDKWLKSLDRGKSPSDTTLLKKQLESLKENG